MQPEIERKLEIICSIFLIIIGVFVINNYDTIISQRINETPLVHHSLNTDYVKLTVTYTPNAAPSFTSGPSDNGSNATTPTNVGADTTFSATSSDSESDQWKLLVCSTSTAPTASSTTPTCAGGDGNKYCVSSSWVAADAQNTCARTALVGDSESNAWYAFTCDNSWSPACSESSQGEGDNGSPFKINHVPELSGYFIGGFNYAYRKSIPVNHTDDGAQTNYQIKLLVGYDSGDGGTVDCNSRCQTDFDDLRFTTSDGSTLIDYWIESVTGTYLATVWVKIPSIPVHPDDTSIYMYYGNSSATGGSNGTNTFIAFDDFERGNDGDTVGGSWTEGTAHCHISTEQDIGNVAGFTGTRSVKMLGALGTAPSMTIVKTAGTNYAYRFRAYKENAARFYTTHGNGTERVYMRFNTDEDVQYYNGSYNSTGDSMAADDWQLFEINDIDLSVPKYDIWLNGSSIQDNADTYNNTAGNGTISLSGSNVADGDDTYIDDFIIRNWTANEPTWGAPGSEDSTGYILAAYPSSIDPGEIITFGIGAHDDDVDTATDTVALLVCKTSGVSDTACDGGAGDTWCGLSTATSSNPSCTSTATGVGSKEYYAYIFDNHSLGATDNGTSSTFTVSNSTPSVGTISPSSVSLVESATTTASATSTVTDNNGYADISSVTAVFYDSVATSATCSASTSTCYSGISCATSSCNDNQCIATCSTDVWYYANPSDWKWQIKATDAASASSTTLSSTVTIANLIALDVSASTISYGSLSLGDTSEQATTSVENTGNTNLDVDVYGTNMTCDTGTIAVGQQKFNTGGGETALTGVAQTIDLNVAKRITTPPSGSIYWKLYVPASGSKGECSGTNTFEARNGG